MGDARMIIVARLSEPRPVHGTGGGEVVVSLCLSVKIVTIGDAEGLIKVRRGLQTVAEG